MGNTFFNSLAMFDADGTVMGNYRKTHIPHATGYEEKYYFTPGNTGFKVFDTRFAKVGCGICWDQWFPETARSLAILGAEVMLFPTAIGSEPGYPEIDNSGQWQLVANDGTGALTLTDMGASFAIAKGGVLTLFFAAPPNGSSVWVRTVDEVSGAVFEQEMSADLPAYTQFLSPRLFMSNGATAAAVAYNCTGGYVKTDY